MVKHLCGVCKVNARSAAILCTGPCNKWHHFKCIGLSLSDIKNMKERNIVGNWKCLKCNQNTEDKECDISGINESNDDISDQINCSSLADEMNKSILLENEVLKQQLFQTKNQSSYYILELEDKIKESEEKTESQEKIFNKRENELISQIRLLEQKLKNEKEARENLILQVEEEAEYTPKNDDEAINRKCNRCIIYKEEVAKMLDTIRSLESINKMLERESMSKSTCLNCFPCLSKCTQETLPVAKKWQKAPSHNQRNSSVMHKEITSLDFTSRNPFEVLQNISEEKSNENEFLAIPNHVNTLRVNNQTSSRKTKKPVFVNERKNYSPKNNNTKKPKILLCADSHGRDLAFHLNKCSNSFDAVGFVRPGGVAEQILNHKNIDGEALGPEDVLVIVCGSNNVARNEAEKALISINSTVQKYNNTRIILVDLPTRHDLKEWSCVNKELKKTNLSLEALSHGFGNVSLVKSSIAERDLHTRHGMHFNEMGKKWLARRIYDALVTTTEQNPTTFQSALDSQMPVFQSSSAGRELCNIDQLKETVSSSDNCGTNGAISVAPATETPAAETYAAETPAAETPAAETTATETPAAETPAASTPATCSGNRLLLQPPSPP